MARVNVGIDPLYLSDQHLIAESVEITMITGALRKDGFIIKGKVPKDFCLGTGHINFFKPKIKYLFERLQVVNAEMINRSFKPGTHIDIQNNEYIKNKLLGEWVPTHTDSILVRQRISERLKQPKKAKSGFHKYYGKPIEDIEQFSQKMIKSKLYTV